MPGTGSSAGGLHKLKAACPDTGKPIQAAARGLRHLRPSGLISQGNRGMPALARCLKFVQPAMDSSFKIVIVDENPIRAAILEDGLREAGHVQVVRIDEMAHLLARIYAIDPDVILIDLENPSRDVLEQMFQVSRAVRRPVAMFVDQSDAASIEAAVDAGVSAYIVGGLRKERIQNILDLCISRFNAFSRLQDELDRTRSALEERKVIDRAKGILMKAKEPHRGNGLRDAAQDRHEREQEDRRGRAIGDHRRGAVQMSDNHLADNRLRIGFIPLVRRHRADRRGRQGLHRRAKGSMSISSAKCRGRTCATSSTSACSTPRI